MPLLFRFGMKRGIYFFAGLFLLLFVSGAALALCVGSRPTISLCAVVLIPFFVDILRTKKLNLTHRLIQAASFTLPVAVGAVLIMLYNNARFDSPFQFGNPCRYRIAGGILEPGIEVAGIFEVEQPGHLLVYGVYGLSLFFVHSLIFKAVRTILPQI